MSLAVLAQDMASKGRNGDSMLVHMTPGEVAGLQALALKHGGSLTINPDTGLPEANFLKKLLPMLAGFALGPAGFGIVSSGLTAGAIVGGVTGLATGSLSKGLMAGLGAYGGFGIGESLANLGSTAVSAEAMAAANASADPIASLAGAKDAALASGAVAPSGFDAAMQGAKMAFDNPASLVNSAGAKDLFKYGMAAASPVLADQMVPTTTKLPTVDTGNIRKFSFDPYSQRYTPQGIFPAAGYKGGMANGGIVALAEGGTSNPAPLSEQYVTNIKNWFNNNPTATAADVQSAMQQYGLNQQDVMNAMGQAGFSKAAQFAAFNNNIGSANNTAETYGGLKGLSDNINYWLRNNASASADDINNAMNQWSLSDADFQRATGKSIADYLSANTTGDDTVTGGSGNDTVVSGAGNDTVVSGAGNDTISGAGNDTVVSGAGNDTVVSGAGNDTISGGAGNDTVTGGGLTDLINNLATNDSTANDFLTGTSGYNQADVTAALDASGLSDAAKYALTHSDIGSAANTSETYGGLKGLSDNINYWLKNHPGASAQDIRREMAKYGISEEDFIRATGTDVNKYAMGPITEVQNLAEGAGGGADAKVNENGTITSTALGNTNVITNADGTKTVMPTNTMSDIRNLYTRGGGSTGYVVNAPINMAEFDRRFNTYSPGSDSEAAYKYLMGQGAYPTQSNVGEIMRPYSEAVLGVPQDITTKRYLYDNRTRKMVLNPDYVPMSFDTKGVQSFGLSTTDVKKYLTANNTATDAQVYAWALSNNVGPDQIAAALDVDPALIRAKYDAARKAAGTTGGTTGGTEDLTNKDKKPTSDPGTDKLWDWSDSSNKWITVPVAAMADGGATGYALGGLGSLGGYSDGGRLLKGPGDGVSDSIPATIGRKKQPARLADGEFVIPARIVSELGNGSTEAGARKLYAMMDRVQRARGKTTGKNKVAANSRADKYLPA